MKCMPDLPWLRLRVRMLRAKIEGLSGTPLQTEIDMLSPEYVVWINTTPNYPSPHAIGYQNCPKCPDSLPAAVEKKVPGGKFSGDFPDVKKAFKY